MGVVGWMYRLMMSLYTTSVSCCLPGGQGRLAYEFQFSSDTALKFTYGLPAWKGLLSNRGPISDPAEYAAAVIFLPEVRPEQLVEPEHHQLRKISESSVS